MPLMRGGERPTRADERLGFLFAVARDPMFILERDETLGGSVIVDCNQKALELFGYRRDRLLGKPLRFVEALDAPVEAVVDASEHTAEGVHRRADGQVIVVERSFKPIESGGRDLLLVAFRDVTTARLLEKAILRVQQMDNIGLVSGTLVHDFRNLLVSILANAELALASPEGEPTMRERVSDIVESARRATDIVDRVLPGGGGLEQDLNPIDLNELVRESVAMMEPSLPSHVTAAVEPARGDLMVEGDATQLRQVVMNLVINAAEAIDSDSGTIRITTGRISGSRVDLGGAVPPISPRPSQCIYIDVRDNGSGIDTATRDRIFEPLFTTKSSGTGLGLTAVLFAVRRHGGTLTLQSSPGKGSTFRVLLPDPEGQ